MLKRYWELFITALILYSVATHFIEVEYAGTDRSVGFWLWSERVVATIFTIEYLVRWRYSGSWLYPFSAMAIIDLLAILPFYIGFLVDLRSLRLVRTLRVLRLFKLGRHSTALQNLAAAFHRIRHEFSIIGLALVILMYTSSLAMHELERERQPEKFGRLSDAIWFVLVTVTTVGYGDMVPVTAEGRIIAGCTMLGGLMLFGTFVSLVGGAFVEELRKARADPAGNRPTNPNPAAESDLPAIGIPLDPEQALCVIGRGKMTHGEAVRLLALACLILRERNGDGASGSG